VAFTPDGKRALVTTEGDNRIAVLSIDGTKVEAAERVIAAGLRPSALDIAASGDVAVVANSGIGGGDADTISVIDLRANPPRVVGTYTVGQTPSGVRISPNGRYVAVTVTNGSDKAPSSPFYRDSSLLQVWSRSGTQLAKAGEISLGKWCQGVAWSRNSRTLLVQCMVEEEISIVRFSGLAGRSLQKVGAIKVKGGPAGIRSVGR
jgi:DNA-binding beta-propeller fold protein YncE